MPPRGSSWHAASWRLRLCAPTTTLGRRPCARSIATWIGASCSSDSRASTCADAPRAAKPPSYDGPCLNRVRRRRPRDRPPTALRTDGRAPAGPRSVRRVLSPVATAPRRVHPRPSTLHASCLRAWPPSTVVRRAPRDDTFHLLATTPTAFLPIAPTSSGRAPSLPRTGSAQAAPARTGPAQAGDCATAPYFPPTPSHTPRAQSRNRLLVMLPRSLP